jgi:hypothetical protein
MNKNHWIMYIRIALKAHGYVLGQFTPKECVVSQLVIYKWTDFGFLKNFDDRVCHFKLANE